MIKFIEEAVLKFNASQISANNTENEIIKTIFDKLGQNLWFQQEDELFIKHLDKLKENAHYKRDLEGNIESNAHENMDVDTHIDE